MVVAEPVGLSGDVEDDAAVQESVEECCGDGGIAEGLAPAGDRPVGGEDDAGFEVALVHDLEQR